MIVVLVIWNVLLTWYVFKHVEVYNHSMQEIARAFPNLRIKRH